ncbi:hypothetical protein BROOK1789C_587 [Bathymodiolus brooksi thiotrophic gill symbiont]|nr:hypothetical protein BROOK1789C_587 [Bathymodiolus brooksi thiotrophic gill symbiont]
MLIKLVVLPLKIRQKKSSVTKMHWIFLMFLFVKLLAYLLLVIKWTKIFV